MTTTKFPFTKQRIDALPLPDKRTYFYDSRVPGLALSVTPAGAKSFYYIRWLNGKTAFQRLENGGYPAMTPDQARDAVTRLNGEAAAGVDPTEAKRERRAEMTLKDAMARWTEYGQQHKRSWQQDVGTYRRYLEPWDGKRLSAITRRAVGDWHRILGEKRRERGAAVAAGDAESRYPGV